MLILLQDDVLTYSSKLRKWKAEEDIPMLDVPKRLVPENPFASPAHPSKGPLDEQVGREKVIVTNASVYRKLLTLQIAVIGPDVAGSEVDLTIAVDKPRLTVNVPKEGLVITSKFSASVVL